jgi:hypothetical protein
MTDPTTPATPEEPTPAAGTTPETPGAPEAVTAESVAPAVASDPMHAARTEPAAADPYVAAPSAPAANPYAAPAAAAAPGYAAAEPVKQTLSLVSFIIGIVSFVLAWFAGFGLITGIVAVVLGFMGKKREPQAPKWMWIIGIVGGFVAIALGIIVFIVSVILPLIFLASFGSLYSSY